MKQSIRIWLDRWHIIFIFYILMILFKIYYLELFFFFPLLFYPFAFLIFIRAIRTLISTRIKWALIIMQKYSCQGILVLKSKSRNHLTQVIGKKKKEGKNINPHIWSAPVRLLLRTLCGSRERLWNMCVCAYVEVCLERAWWNPI